MKLQPVLAVALCAIALTSPTVNSQTPTSTIKPLNAPIPIHFQLAEAGVVTLVIEGMSGKRVRNLVSETPFPAGKNVVYWDGLDESGRVNESTNGIYDVRGKLVQAGNYRVRGLVHKPLDLRYEFTIYNAGQVPWSTQDRASQWLTNHTPPSAVLYLPFGAAPKRAVGPATDGQLLVGSQVSEGGSGLAWLDTEGRKLHGQEWVGGVWTGASHLARDTGDKPVAGVYAYTATTWAGDKHNDRKTELRLHELVTADQKRENSGAWVKGIWDPAAKGNASDARMGTGEDRRLLTPNFYFPHPLKPEQNAISGLAVYNGTLVASLPTLNQLLFVDARDRKILGAASLSDPRGVAFDSQGRLLVLSGTMLLRFEMPSLTATDGIIALPAAQTLVKHGLDDPQVLALDKAGQIYVSNRGALHQVKVFTHQGQFVRSIGKPGVPQAGAYDEQRMNNPYGLTISQTPQGERLWVAEQDFKPKRLSVWKLDGSFERAFYGPTIYGGGGSLDPGDKTRFFHDGIEFKIDWKTGEDKPVNIYYRSETGQLSLPVRKFGKVPETPLRAQGRLYITDAYTGNPTQGVNIAGIYQMRQGQAHLVAAAGVANEWDALKAEELKSLLPSGADLNKKLNEIGATTFVWSDLNGDGRLQTTEVQFRVGWKGGGVTVLSDLSFVLPDSSRLTPLGFNAIGAPRYNLSKSHERFDWKVPRTSGGGQILDFPDGYSVATAGPILAFRANVTGAEKVTVPTWTYPNQWPGLHASHYARIASSPGEILGATRLLGLPMTFKSADTQDKVPFNVWGINGNMGTASLMTSDGLFVGTLFKDHRQAKPWPNKAVRGMALNEQSLGSESFFNTITQSSDGLVYVQSGNHMVRVDGLNSLRRLPVQTIRVTPQLLTQAQNYFVQRDAARQQAKGTGKLSVEIRTNAPVLDGKLDEWKAEAFVPLDAKTKAAAMISGDRLYLAYKTGYKDLLKNKIEALPLAFKTGGALDLHIAADTSAPDKRQNPVSGDQRLLITRNENNQLVVVRYRAVVAGTTTERVPFASPTRVVSFDRVDDVSDEVRLVQGKAPIEEFRVGNVFGNRTEKYEGTSYEVSIPISTLGLNPVAGSNVRGDLGILVGNGFQTIQRIYWNNKATGLISDIPGEAMLTPQLWGQWQFTSAN